MATSKTSTAKASTKSAAKTKKAVETSVTKTAATTPKATKAATPKTAKSKSSMLGLVASAINAEKDGHDISAVTAKSPALAKAVRVAKKSATPKPVVAKEPKEPKVQTIRNKGPRGFRVDSPAWLKSIADCKGIALLPANLPKLLDTAEVKGVAVTSDLQQSEIVAMISKVLVAA